MNKDNDMTWKDDKGNVYKIGYSQQLQADTLKELERGNILRLIMIILAIIIVATLVLIAFTGVMTQVMRQVVC